MRISKTLVLVGALAACSIATTPASAAPRWRADGPVAHAANRKCAAHHRPHRAPACTRKRHSASRASSLASHPVHPAVTVPARAPAPTVAPALPAPPAVCPDVDLLPAPTNIDRLTNATLCLINQERGHHGLVALVPDRQLQAAAQHHTDDMVSNDYFDHVSPSGESPLTRDRASGYVPDSAGYEIGENIAWGTLDLSTPNAIVRAWINSPEHLANILDPNYRQTAVAVDPSVPSSLGQGQPGAMYTQEFGVIQLG